MLADALEVSADMLKSSYLPNQLKPVKELLESNFLNELPLDMFGINLAKVVEIIANSPLKVGAFISTLVEIARNYSFQEENFYFGALRSYLEINNNYFAHLEDAVIAFKKEHNLEGPTVSEKQLAQILETNYGYNIEPEGAPVMRYALFGFVLLAILGGGGYLALNNLDFKKKDPGQQAQGQQAEVAPAEKIDEAVTEDDVSKPKTRLSPAEAWVKALETDTLEGYREYLENFSAGANADKARAEIRRFDDEAFAEAERRDTVSSYQSYLDQFPKGAHVAEARAAIKAIQNARSAAQRKAAQEKAAWQKAAATNTADAYQTYLNAYSGGVNAAEARSRLDAMKAKDADTSAFNAAKSLNTKTAYQTYMSSYPQGQHVPEAMKAIDNLTPRAGGNLKDCDVCPPMKILSSGGFQQGAGPDDSLARSTEKPERRVDFGQMFAIGVTEVTFTQWNACVSGGGCPAVSDQGWGGGTRPVINVTWGQAKSYADWLSQKTGERYSLPSESQWEYAARGGEIRPFLGGSTKGVCVFANGAGQESGASWANPDCQDPAGDRTMPVGSLASNQFGLKDVLGNVAEWTLDCGSLNYRDAPADGSANMRGSCRQRITRGGSWFAGPRDMRLSSRAPMRQDDKNEFTGFRVVRAVKN